MMITQKQLEKQLDLQISALKSKTEYDIYVQWLKTKGIFRFIRPFDRPFEKSGQCGCLISVHNGSSLVHSAPGLTEAIRKDKRLPVRSSLIRPKHFPAMKEWTLQTYDHYHVPKELNCDLSTL